MKKIILSIGLVLLAASMQAQVHLSQSFLNVSSLKVTNTVIVSNLLGGVTFGTAWTNGANGQAVRLAWTNLAGVKQWGGMGTTNLYFNTLKDVSLWTDRNGLPSMATLATGVGPVAVLNNTNNISAATLHIRGYSYGAATLTFTFKPVWDGRFIDSSANRDFTVTVATGATNTIFSLATNAPTWMWPGAKALRLHSIANGTGTQDTDADLFNVSLNGFVP